MTRSRSLMSNQTVDQENEDYFMIGKRKREMPKEMTFKKGERQLSIVIDSAEKRPKKLGKSFSFGSNVGDSITNSKQK